MLSDLLISSQATMGIIIAAACVFGVALILYGVFKKFNQMGWLPWQILVIFAVMLVTKFIPTTLEPTLRLGVICAIFLIVTALVIGAGEAIRHVMLVRVRPANLFLRICNRLLGAVTGVLGLAVVLVAVAGFALPICQFAIPPARDILGPILFENAVYQSLSQYLFDFFLIAFLVSTVHAGYRVGLGRGLLTLLMCVFALGALALAIYFAVAVPGLKNLSSEIGGAIRGNRAVATLVGYLISILIWFTLIFTVLSLFGWLIHLLIRKIRYVRPFAVIGGIIMAIIFFVLVLVIFSGVGAVVSWMSSGGLRKAIEGTGVGGLESLISTIEQYARGIADAFTSSPFGAALYNGNAITGLLPS